VSLLLAQVSSLLHTRFDLPCRRLGRHEVVSRVLQDAYPTEPAHAFTVSTVVFHLLFGVVRARFGEGLWDLVGCGFYTKREGLLDRVGTWDRMDVRGPKIVRGQRTVWLLILEIFQKLPRRLRWQSLKVLLLLFFTISRQSITNYCDIKAKL
jgi:hypothetical protein